MRNKTLALTIGGVLLIALAGLALSGGDAEASLSGTATLFKDPSCGCCGGYAAFLQREGVDVNQVATADMNTIKQQHDIPRSMQSCHTTVLGDYVIEGHVPQAAVERLLTEQPDIRGIAVPGMPTGTPGMPGPAVEVVVYALNHDGSVSEWMRT